MSMRHAPALVLAWGIIALAGSAVAEIVTGTFSGTVTEVDGWGGARPPGDVATGDAVLGCFRYDTADAVRWGSWPPQYRFRNQRSSTLALSITGLVWRSGQDMGVTVGNDGEHEDGLIDMFEVEYSAIRDSRPDQHPGSMYLPELYSNRGVIDSALFEMVLKGPEPDFLRSDRLPAEPDDLRLDPALQAWGSISSFGGPLGHWRIMFEPDPLSLRINREPVAGAAAGPLRDKAALEAARLCEDRDS